MNTTSPKNFLKVVQLDANKICNKTDEIQLLIKNTQANVNNTRDKTQSIPRRLNIPQFTPIRTDCTHKQEGLLTSLQTSVSLNSIH